MPDFKINFTFNRERLKSITTLDSLRVKKKKKRASLVAQMVRNHLQCRRPEFDSWVGKIPWRRAWQRTPVFFWLENSMDRGAWRATHHGVAKSQTQLSD